MDEHTQKICQAFAEVVNLESWLAEKEKAKADAEAKHKQSVNEAKAALDAATSALEALIKESGEYEVLIEGKVTDFKISFQEGRESVKADPDATPDEFCKIERKPKLKEIGDHLKNLRDAGQPLPNWASFEKGATKLAWKAIKKSTKGKESA